MPLRIEDVDRELLSIKETAADVAERLAASRAQMMAFEEELRHLRGLHGALLRYREFAEPFPSHEAHESVRLESDSAEVPF